MMKTLLTTICLIAALVCLTPASHADLLVYEGFDYEVGNLGSGDGGTGWSSAWSSANPPTGSGAPATHTVVSDSLTYGDLITSGNQGRLQASSTSPAFRTPSSSFTLSEATPELWISFIAVSDSAGSSGHLGIALFNNTTEQTLIGKRGSTANWGISVGAPGGGSSVHSDVAANSVTFLLFKYTWTGAASAATIQFWANPDLANESLLGDPDASTTINNFTFNQVRLSSASNGNIDEIRIGTTFSSVTPIPEPGSLALLGLGGLMMLVRGRRHG